MKKLLVGVSLAVLMGSAFAATPPMSRGEMQGDMRKGPRPEMQGQMQDKKMPSVDEMKARILKHIAERDQKTAALKQCVSAATTHDALRKCMPERRGGGDGQWEKRRMEMNQRFEHGHDDMKAPFQN